MQVCICNYHYLCNKSRKADNELSSVKSVSLSNSDPTTPTLPPYQEPEDMSSATLQRRYRPGTAGPVPLGLQEPLPHYEIFLVDFIMTSSKSQSESILYMTSKTFEDIQIGLLEPF